MPAASVQFNGFIPASTGVDTVDAKEPGFFARFVKAIHEAQIRRTEREIARFIETSGGRMTDDLERKIESHFV